MDDVDRANAQKAGHDAACLEAHRRMMPTGPGSDICLGCGEPIPAERRRLKPSASHCVDCQWEIENGA
jgi:phage/conjugal plasmid C-4 type zinc finger TraR family protein